MRNIACLNKISPFGLKALPANYKIVEDINAADAVLVRSFNMLEMDLPSSLLAIGRAGAGVNNIPLDKAAENGIVVFNTPGANANAVKELTILAMLMACRDIKGSMKWVDDNKNDEAINKSMEKAKSAFAGTEIYGKTLGVIGLGAIGALVANAANALGMHIIAVEPSDATIFRNKHLLPNDIEIVSYDELYKRADFISVHVPLLDSTRGMINKDAFKKMKDGVVIINCARDAIVNDDDMKIALKEKKIRKYVTDFPNHKTANMDGVISFSHLGASTEEAEDNCALMAVKEVTDYLENGNIINSVNFPRLDLGVRTGTRLLVLCKSDKLTDIKKVIDNNANVKAFVSGEKGLFKAALFDIDKAFDLDLIKPLSIKVRLLVD